MVTFGDSNKSFKLDVDVSKSMTNQNFNLTHSHPQDQKLFFEFRKEMNFVIKQKGPKNNRDESLIRLLQSPAIMVSGTSIVFLPKILVNYMID